MIKFNFNPGLEEKTDAVIFDLGGVLLNVDYEKSINAFIELGFENFDNIFGKLKQSELFSRFETGLVTPSEFREELRKMVNKEISDEEIDSAWNAMLLDFPPERLELLSAMKNRFRLFLLSNTNAIHTPAFENILKEEYGILDFQSFFEKVYYSHKIGLRKPGREVFDFVVRENELDPERTLFIDDTKHHVEGAASAGLVAVHLDDDRTITDLITVDNKNR